MNIQAMMAQAKKLQKELENTTKQIENSTYNYDNDNIYVEANGKNEIIKVSIKNDEILEDKEMLEDIVVVAVNNVLDQIKADKEKKLGKYTNSLGGLF